MTEELYQKCPLCDGTTRVPPGVAVCDYPKNLTPPACVCTLGTTPGWTKAGLTVGQVDRLRKRAGLVPELLAALEEAKSYVGVAVVGTAAPTESARHRATELWCKVAAVIKKAKE